MTKKQILKHVNQYDNLEPRTFYHSSQFGRPSDYWIVIDDNGKAFDVTYNREEWKKNRNQRDIDKIAKESIKKEDALNIKKDIKSKKELDELKNNPETLQNQLDEKYIQYQALSDEYKKWAEENLDLLDESGDRAALSKKNPKHAQGRVKNAQKISALNDLYDTAKIYNSLKKDDDPTDYYGEVVNAITGMPTTSVKDPSQIKSLPKTEDIYSDDPVFSEKSREREKLFTTKKVEVGTKEQRKLSDQEILEKLKLRQK